MFHPVVVVLRGVQDAMPKTLDEAIEKVRKYSSQQVVAAEMIRSKAPSSHHVYLTEGPPAKHHKPNCRMHALGKCRFADKCKFSHMAVPTTRAKPSDRQGVPARKCAYCGKLGHSARRCATKFLAETPKDSPARQPAASAL